MNQHELLTELDNWHNGHSDRYTAELLRQAAVEIRKPAVAESGLSQLSSEVTERIQLLEQRIQDGKDHFHNLSAQQDALRWVLDVVKKNCS